MCIKKKKEYTITLDKAWSLSKEWKTAALIWRTLDHLFVLGSFTASIAVIYITAENDGAKILIITLSALSALFTLTSYACNPFKYMTSYRKAFDALNDALVTNTDVEGNLINGEDGRKMIVGAIKQGEKYIGRTFEIEFNPKEKDCHDK